jgi:hypothetical protein
MKQIMNDKFKPKLLEYEDHIKVSYYENGKHKTSKFRTLKNKEAAYKMANELIASLNK